MGQQKPVGVAYEMLPFYCGTDGLRPCLQNLPSVLSLGGSAVTVPASMPVSTAYGSLMGLKPIITCKTTAALSQWNRLRCPL